MDSNQLFNLYKSMKRIAMVEDSIAERYNSEIRKMHTPIHLCNGQEAVAVGVCSCLEKEDMIFSNHRNHGHYLAKGGNLKAMIAELYSKETGCCHGKGGSMHLFDLENGISLSSAIVAGNVSIATGYALANKLKKNGRVTCVFFGDGASEEGSVYESICLAKIKNIPIIYICENNRYAINTPLSDREPFSYISQKFERIIPCRIIDGYNIEDIYTQTKDAVNNVKAGNGPILLEFMTYRFRDHSNTGDGVNTFIRTQDEWDSWKKRDVIVELENKLIFEDKIYKTKIQRYIEDVNKEILNAFEFAEKSDFPTKEALFKNVY